MSSLTAPRTYRLTQYAHGGGCACKIPPGELEDVRQRPRRRGRRPTCWSGWTTATTPPWCGSTATGRCVATADFFTPVVDDPYDWGRIAAANALSDVYAMGGRPVVAVNLLGWPRDVLPLELRARCCAAGWTSAARPACHVAGGHSIDDPEPKYGMAVTGLADPARLLRNDAARAGLPISADQAARRRRAEQPAQGHRRGVRAGDRHDDRPQRRGSRAALDAGIEARPPTSPGSACSATLLQDGPRLRGHRGHRRGGRALPRGRARGAADGYVSGGTRRNLDWVRPHLTATVDEDELVLLADAQTSGGLLVAGEVPGAPVIGEFVPRGEPSRGALRGPGEHTPYSRSSGGRRPG